MTEIKEYKRTAKVGDIEVGTYIEKVKVVDGEEVYDDDLFCESMIAENEVVRKYFDLISLDDQIKLPRRYAIPRKYLNIVLDLYEEIWEYETPSSEESDRMKKAVFFASLQPGPIQYIIPALLQCKLLSNTGQPSRIIRMHPAEHAAIKKGCYPLAFHPHHLTVTV